MTKSKLADRLADKSIKFTDYAINKYQCSEELFSKIKDKSISIRFENSGLKGLKLFQYKNTKKKYFVQQFWFDKRSQYWTVGEFRLGVYGVNECKKHVNEMMDTHTNADGSVGRASRLHPPRPV